MTLLEEDEEVSNADTDRDSGFCDDTFLEERLDNIENLGHRNQTELIKVGQNISPEFSKIIPFRLRVR